MENEYYPFTNLPLPYAYDAMEPYIDEKTMELHHDRHLQTYINNLNAILKDHPDLQQLSLQELILSVPRLPYELQMGILNNAGGVFNHRFYFALLANPSERRPEGRLAEAISRDFGSLEAFLEAFKKAALSVFGSGYAWLVSDQGKLRIVTTPNQNTTLGMELCPVINIDVWEHAYYLKHYNVRADYIDDWSSIINWEQAEQNYMECLC